MKRDRVEISGYHATFITIRRRANALRGCAKALGRAFNVLLGRWHDKAVGPHPQAMYQVAFLPDEFGATSPGSCSTAKDWHVLVHPETGDDVTDIPSMRCGSETSSCSTSKRWAWLDGDQSTAGSLSSD